MWWVGIVEALGNASVIGILVWRMRSTWKARWYSLLGLQSSAVLWFASNVMYAVYYVMWEAFEIDWWSGFHYDVTKAAQQIAIIALPLATLNLMSQVIKSYNKASRLLVGNR